MSIIDVISDYTFECQRCGHIWPPRYMSNIIKSKPKVCPSCKSPYWDSLKKICIACSSLGRSLHHIFPLTLWLYRDFDSTRKSILRNYSILLCSSCHQTIHRAIKWIIEVYWQEKKNNPLFNFQNAIEEDLIILSVKIKNSNRDRFMLYASEIQIQRFSKR